MAILSNQHNETLDKIHYQSLEIYHELGSIHNTIEVNNSRLICHSIKIITILFIAIILVIFSITSSMIMTHKDINDLNNSIIELNTLLTTKNTEIELLHTEIQDLQQKLDSQINEVVESQEPIEIEYNNYDINNKSGYTAEQFTEIIKLTFKNLNKNDTVLLEIGEGLYQVETEYNVNGLYLLGFASLESGWGASSLAVNSNNLYGLMGMKFDSPIDCTLYMGKLIRMNYLNSGYTSLYSIQRKYCPNGGSTWVNNITWCTNKYIDSAESLYS